MTADIDTKRYCWLHEGLHRLDYTPSPLTYLFRDPIMPPPMLTVALICGTGACFGIRRLRCQGVTARQ